jgi:hypothetical protein
MTQNSWNSNDPVEVAKGGTGASTLGDGYVLLGSGTSAVTALDVTAKGSILVGDGTTDPVALAAGTNDHVLTADSAQASGLKWAAAPGGGGSSLVFLASTTASSSATLEFSSSIDSTYNTYVFMLEDIVTATDLQQFCVRTSTDGGSTFDSGASDYKINGSSTNFNKINTSSNLSTNSNQATSGLVYLFNPSGTTYTKVLFTMLIGSENGTGTSLYSSIIGGGARLSAADVDAIQFFMASGNIASGTIYMYGMTKPS